MPTSSSGSTARSDVSNRCPRIARGSINFRKERRTKRDETSGYQSIYDWRCARSPSRGTASACPSPAAVCRPFWQAGVTPCSFPGPDTPLRRGDIVFYERASGQFVMHRIRRVHRDGQSRHPWRCADRDRDRHPAAAGLCAGDRRRRKGRQLQPGDFLWELFRGPWLWVIPLRRPIVRAWCAQKAPDIIQLQYKITDCEKKSEVVSTSLFSFYWVLEDV